MSTFTGTIRGNTVSILNASPDYSDPLEMRSQLKVTVIDTSGVLQFFRGDPVEVLDSVSGDQFVGFVQSSKPQKLSPDINNPALLHAVICMDRQYALDKRSNEKNYINQYAGDTVIDLVQRIASQEGVTVAAAQRIDTTSQDFTQGTLAGTVVSSTTSGDADLELSTTGTALTITENSTAVFAAGSLSHVAASNNQLVVSTQSALKVSGLMVLAVTSVLSIKFWSGSLTVGTSDTLHYEIWIASSSPAATIGVELIFSDGTTLSSYVGPVDQNGVPGTPVTDLSKYALDQWYSRDIALGSALNGKVVNTVALYVIGATVGTYTAYVKNVYLVSLPGSKFLTTSATALVVNPAQALQSVGYILVAASLVQVCPANASRISTSYSIDAVKLVRSSVISWYANLPGTSTLTVSVSYDAGVSWLTCTNGGTLPLLPPGANVAGMSMLVQESFSVSGTDPTLSPTLAQVVITFLSAANASKSDITATYATAANWNTGTLTNVHLVGNTLVLNYYTRDWNDNQTSGQTFFAATTGTQSQAATLGGYTMTATTQTWAQSRLDFVGTMIDFILDVDVLFTDTIEGCVTYRQTAWNTTNNTFAYQFFLYPGVIEFGRGTNSTTNSYTQLFTTFDLAITTGTVHHMRIVVSGNRHQLYVDNRLTPTVDMTDSTFTGAGNIGLRTFNGSGAATNTITFDNLAVGATSGTWLSPSVSVSSLTTSGGSQIGWQETATGKSAGTALLVETTVDGGSSYQSCTNGGAIPNIPTGTSLSGVSVRARATLTAVTQTAVIDLLWRVLAVYPGASGTRDTAPLGNDTMVRGNVVGGFGTGFDSQSYTKVGTGTVALTSNEATIANTTGDVHMVYGSRTWTDEEATCKFSLSASTVSGGVELRYVDANNFYRLSVSTTAITLSKKVSAITTSLATAVVALSTGVSYYLRFRITGSGPILAFGRVWASGTLEPTTWNVTG